MLDDLDSAGERMRGKKHHRMRNILVLLGAAAAALFLARLWRSEQTATSSDYGETAPSV
jgi:hypothetical protein